MSVQLHKANYQGNTFQIYMFDDPLEVQDWVQIGKRSLQYLDYRNAVQYNYDGNKILFVDKNHVATAFAWLRKQANGGKEDWELNG